MIRYSLQEETIIFKEWSETHANVITAQINRRTAGPVTN